MRRYDDYKRKKDGQPYKKKTQRELTEAELNTVEWAKYVIVVPTEAERQEMMQAFKHIHDSDVDPNYIAVNSLIHQYLETNAIIVDKELYEKLNPYVE